MLPQNILSRRNQNREGMRSLWPSLTSFFPEAGHKTLRERKERNILISEDTGIQRKISTNRSCWVCPSLSLLHQAFLIQSDFSVTIHFPIKPSIKNTQDALFLWVFISLWRLLCHIKPTLSVYAFLLLNSYRNLSYELKMGWKEANKIFSQLNRREWWVFFLELRNNFIK